MDGSFKTSARMSLPALNFYHGAGGDGHIGFGFIGVASDAGFADFDFKNAEVAQFDFASLGKGFDYVIQGFLDDIKKLASGSGRSFPQC